MFLEFKGEGERNYSPHDHKSKCSQHTKSPTQGTLNIAAWAQQIPHRNKQITILTTITIILMIKLLSISISLFFQF